MTRGEVSIIYILNNEMVISVLEKFAPKKTGIALFWIIFWVAQSTLMSGGEAMGFYLIKNIAIVGLQIVVVTINIEWLYPRLFAKRKYIAYVLAAILLVYLVFSVSFFFIDLALSLTSISLNFSGVIFSTDFWIVLSGSSFYSLVLVCSTLYKVMEANREKDKVNQQLLYETKSAETKYQNLKERLDFSKTKLTIKEGNKKHMIAVDDIYYIRGLKEYVVWHTKNGKIVTLDTLSGLTTRLESKNFIRIHKSFIVNTEHIVSVKSGALKIKDEEIPVGRAYKKNLLNIKG